MSNRLGRRSPASNGVELGRRNLSSCVAGGRSLVFCCRSPVSWVRRVAQVEIRVVGCGKPRPWPGVHLVGDLIAFDSSPYLGERRPLQECHPPPLPALRQADRLSAPECGSMRIQDPSSCYSGRMYRWRSSVLLSARRATHSNVLFLRDKFLTDAAMTATFFTWQTGNFMSMWRNSNMALDGNCCV